MASVAVIMADPKHSEERLKHESVALPEEIDKGSMCDEIVGSSGALQKVLSLVSKVAPTEATVLVTAKPEQARNLLRAPFTGGLTGPHDLLSVSTVLPSRAT